MKIVLEYFLLTLRLTAKPLHNYNAERRLASAGADSSCVIVLQRQCCRCVGLLVAGFPMLRKCFRSNEKSLSLPPPQFISLVTIELCKPAIKIDLKDASHLRRRARTKNSEAYRNSPVDAIILIVETVCNEVDWGNNGVYWKPELSWVM